MCPCTVLGAASQDLPPEVAREVKGFFKMCLDKLVAEGLSANSAAEVLSTIAGALVVANALGDTAAYDRATSDLLRQREAARAGLRSKPRRLGQRGRAPIRRRSS
jgi:TetR/AcrR family transcriptional repressor of nem operon